MVHRGDEEHHESDVNGQHTRCREADPEQIVVDEPQQRQRHGGADHDNQPVKYKCLKSEHSINLGTFSRKRTGNTTSGTVMG